MRKIILGMAILLASCSVAMADCEPLKNEDGDRVGRLQVCDKLEMKTSRPRCYDFGDEFGNSKWLCTGEIGQPVARERVLPENCKKVNGKLVCPKS